MGCDLRKGLKGDTRCWDGTFTFEICSPNEEAIVAARLKRVVGLHPALLEWPVVTSGKACVVILLVGTVPLLLRHVVVQKQLL